MKYLKTFETFQNQTPNPQAGQYVICEIDQDDDNSQLITFVKEHIGRLVEIIPHRNYNFTEYTVEFDVPVPGFASEDGNVIFLEREIKYWSYSKEDMELLLQAIKYNL